MCFGYALFFRALERRIFFLWTYSGENALDTITSLFLIVSNVMFIFRIIIKLAGNQDMHKISEEFEFWSHLSYYLLRSYLPLSNAKCCGLDSASSFDRILFKLAGTQERHKENYKILDEFDFGPDRSIASMVTCP